MNRRGFLSGMLKLGAAFAILPPASTYSRIWRAERQWKCILPEKLHAFWMQTSRMTYCIDLPYRTYLIQNFSGPLPETLRRQAAKNQDTQRQIYDLPESIISPFLA